MIKRIGIIIILSIAFVQWSQAQENSDSAKLDMLAEEISYAIDTSIVKTKPNFYQKILKYFNDSNKEKKEKKLDFSLIGGPHYSNDSGFGVAILGSGLYYMNGCDTTDSKSTTSMFCDVTTKLNYIVGIEGINIAHKNKYRLNYDITMRHINYEFYGIGYDMCSEDKNMIKMERTDFTLKSSFLGKVYNSLYLGPEIIAQYSYADPKKTADKEKITSEYGYGKSAYQIAVGGRVEYDTRDNVINAYKGIYFNTIYLATPEWIGNKHFTQNIKTNFRGYIPTWKGCILAGEVYGDFILGNISWIQLCQMSRQGRMRGYDTWRYIDRNTVSAQAELRQHIWKRSGAVIWGGVGTTFHDMKSFRHIMPNYGLGYRWEFKKRINVRLDYGFGKRCSSFIFSINEAF